MKILALDPAERTGVAFSSGGKDKIDWTTVWHLPKRAGDSGPQLERLDELLTTAIRQHAPDVIAYELAGHGSHNMQAKAAHNEKCGVVCLVAQRHGLPAWGYQPNVWKARAIANGRAKKPEVIRRLRMFFGIEVGSEDEADACGVLLAAQVGPPAEPKRKQETRARKRLAKVPRLF